MLHSHIGPVLRTDLTNPRPDGYYNRLSRHLTDKNPDLVAENKRLHAEILRLQVQLTELTHTADTDPLVNIYNRRAFVRELERAQAVNNRYGIMSTIIFFDLNNFKRVNDQFGHNVGDTLLKQVGACLTRHVRECDLAARLGGDEFGVLLFKTDVETAKVKAAALASQIREEYVDMPVGPVRVSAAWGVASCNTRDDLTQILARADRNMYKTKNRAAT